MEDKQIIDLYFARDEQAITETEQKYGRFCWRIAMNVLDVWEDAEECVSDTYLSAWKQIPPTIPLSLKAFLGRIVRNLSISRFRTLRAKKRFQGMEVMLSELGDCVPSDHNVEQTVEAKELSGYISEWLDSLPEEDCALFVRRYWFGDSVQELAEKCGITAAQMAQRMLRLRKGLRSALEQKGVAL
ncbi:MAG: sigma-70 family RNA polymerase sigma factor [Lachnospiraceae bacterium]|nr:sigma-70 family RNA polymerase sigma factor [Lachnospiraceae bacterium]